METRKTHITYTIKFYHSGKISLTHENQLGNSLCKTLLQMKYVLCNKREVLLRLYIYCCYCKNLTLDGTERRQGFVIKYSVHRRVSNGQSEGQFPTKRFTNCFRKFLLLSNFGLNLLIGHISCTFTNCLRNRDFPFFFINYNKLFIYRTTSLYTRVYNRSDNWEIFLTLNPLVTLVTVKIYRSDQRKPSQTRKVENN